MKTSSYREAQKKAYNAVLVAVLQGKLAVVNTLLCADCGEQAKVYHHHNGYGKVNLLDVIPLCNSCHRTRHWSAQRVQAALRFAGKLEGGLDSMKQIGVHIEDNLHRAFKIACIQAERDMSDVLRELIERWVAEQSKPDGKSDVDPGIGDA